MPENQTKPNQKKTNLPWWTFKMPLLSSSFFTECSIIKALCPTKINISSYFLYFLLFPSLIISSISSFTCCVESVLINGSFFGNILHEDLEQYFWDDKKISAPSQLLSLSFSFSFTLHLSLCLSLSFCFFLLLGTLKSEFL